MYQITKKTKTIYIL